MTLGSEMSGHFPTASQIGFVYESRVVVFRCTDGDFLAKPFLSLVEFEAWDGPSSLLTRFDPWRRWASLAAAEAWQKRRRGRRPISW